MSDVLVLDRSFQPVSIISWERAMVLLGPTKTADGSVEYKPAVGTKVEVVAHYEERKIRGSGWNLDMPAVIRFLTASVNERRKKKLRFSRQNIFLRDKGVCQYCGAKVERSEMTYDHVTPTSKGGKTIWENVVTSCIGCNQRKANKTPAQAGMRLLKTPVRPTSLPTSTFAPLFKSVVPKEWEAFISHLRSEVYWKGELET